MPSSGFKLDHVVLLLPYNYLAHPPTWLTDTLTISPGGVHADGKTENRLVLFRDGTYLELIAFVNDDPANRHGHRWDKPFGVVDFALTTAEALDYDGLTRRLDGSETGISYAEPLAGGRRTPDGQELKWKVTVPRGVDAGNVPFFCHDVTPRSRRVPVTRESSTHPSGVLGMAGMLSEVQEGSLQRLSTAVAAILDVPAHAGNRYGVGVPDEMAELKEPSLRLQAASAESTRELSLTLLLQTPSHNPRSAIKEQIGDGVVSIAFE